MKREQLQALWAQLRGEMDTILAKENPTDDELKRVEAIQSEMRGVQKKLDLLDQRDAMNEEENRSRGTLAGKEEIPAERGDGEGRSKVQVGRDNEAERPFRSLGENLVAVYRSGKQGAQVDKRLLRLEELDREERAATGMSEAVPADGGFLVQKDFAAGLLKTTYQTGVLPGRAMRIPISSNANGVKINAINETSRADGSRWGGIRAYWKDEAALLVASRPKLRQINVDLNKLTGLLYATDELLQDAAALEAVIMQGFPEEFGFKLDDAMIRGTGAGQPLGILNSPCLVSVTKENGQAADTVVAENIEKMYARVPARSLPKCSWYINQEVWPQVFQLHHAVGAGGVPMFVPAGGLNQSPNGTLLGRPIEPLEQCAALGDQGDIIFGDFSQYLIADKGGMQSASSIHVQFLYDETVFRFILRVDGQPIPNSPLTPFKGTSTLSPFVTLDERA